MDLMQRRRAMMQAAQASGPVFPVVVEIPLPLNTICLSGNITPKTDWRSSGYIPVPQGATKVRWTNFSAKTGFRAGTPQTEVQTSGITMLNNGSPITVGTGATSAKFSIASYAYLYISRIGTDTSSITVEFLKE